jgi:hypothetical protein
VADIIGARRACTVAMIPLGVDAVQIDAGRAEVGVPELALDDVERHAFAGAAAAGHYLRQVDPARPSRRAPAGGARACLGGSGERPRAEARVGRDEEFVS